MTIATPFELWRDVKTSYFAMNVMVICIYKRSYKNCCVSSLAWPTAFSFDMWAGKKEGLVYYRYPFCAENRQILVIVDWLLISVNILQRCME